MMRNFCVLTMEAAYDPTSAKWTSVYTNHRVLVGPKEKVEKCKAAIEAVMGTEENKLNGFTFSLNEQIHGQ